MMVIDVKSFKLPKSLGTNATLMKTWSVARAFKIAD